MSDSFPEKISESDLDVLNKVARFNLNEGRKPSIAPAFDGFLQLFDLLDAVDLGETPPTNSFDPRWREQS